MGNKKSQTKLEERVEFQLTQFCRENNCPVQRYVAMFKEGTGKYHRAQEMCEHRCWYTGEQLDKWMKLRSYKLKGDEVRRVISSASTANEYYHTLLEMGILPSAKR